MVDVGSCRPHDGASGGAISRELLPDSWRCLLRHQLPHAILVEGGGYREPRESRTEKVGGQVSLYRYVSEFHGIGEFVAGNLRGLTVLPLTKFWSGLSDFPLLDTAVLTAGVGGLLLSVATPLRFLLVAYLGHLIPFAYIQNFPSGRAPRFVMPAYFFLVLAAVWLGYFLVERRNSQEKI